MSIITYTARGAAAATSLMSGGASWETSAVRGPTQKAGMLKTFRICRLPQQAEVGVYPWSEVGIARRYYTAKASPVWWCSACGDWRHGIFAR